MKSSKIKILTTMLSSSLLTFCLVSALPAAASDEERWQDTKQSGKEFWKDFKNDSKQSWKDSKAAFRDGWIESKLETALITNKHLNPFDIDIKVDNYIATLSGEVSNAVELELAEAIAIGIEGIDKVNNQLKVKKTLNNTDNIVESKNRGFTRYLKDASMVADVKTDLFSSSSINGLAINVDVHKAVVTLSGSVGSEAEKDLAEKIAENNKSVVEVINNLKVIR